MNTAIHVLLAGDKDYDPFLLDGLTNKCFLKFSAGELFDLTLGALASATHVKFLLVVGPELLRPRIARALRGKPTAFLEQQESFSQNVVAALLWIKEHHQGSPAIFVTN